jgi:hypothetical protein
MSPLYFGLNSLIPSFVILYAEYSIDIIRTKERFKPSKDIMEESFAKYKSNLQKQVKRGNPECFGPELTDHVWITDCQSYKNLMSNFRCKKLLRTFISLTMFTL